MEALLKLANRELKTIVNERLFTKEALSKFITEFEDITNSQPLMPASDKFDKLEPVMPIISCLVSPVQITNQMSQILRTLT